MPLVPQEVAIALSTDRVQFLEMLQNQLEKTDRQLTKAEGIGLIQLFVELVQERIEHKQMMAAFRDKVENTVIGFGKGLQTQGNKMIAILDGKDPDSYIEDNYNE